MTQPVTRVYTAGSTVAGPQDAVSMDYLAFDSATIIVDISAGMANYAVEFTLDDVNNANITPVWVTMKDFPAGSTFSNYAVVVSPMAFVRINLQSLTGTVQLKIAQSTTPRA